MLLDNFTLHVGNKGGPIDEICAEGVRAPPWGALASDGGPPEFVDVPCRAFGQYVTISLPGPSRILCVCEVEVMGYAGREPFPTPELPSTVFSAGGRQWASLRAQWKSISKFTERCPDEAPAALVLSWATDGDPNDNETLTGSGFEEHSECSRLSICRRGPPLPAVPVSVSPCRRGQLLVNYRPSVSGRYAFILDVGGSIGRSAPWSIVVAAAAPSVALSSVTFEDLMVATPGGGQSAVVGGTGVFYLQARDHFGNANTAQCLYKVAGFLAYERLLSSQHLEHGGTSVAAMQASSPLGWPYSPEVVEEVVDPINITAGACSAGRTLLTFVPKISGIYRIRVRAAVRGLAVPEPGEQVVRDVLEEPRGSGELVEVFPSFQNLSVGEHAPMHVEVAHGEWRRRQWNSWV